MAFLAGLGFFVGFANAGFSPADYGARGKPDGDWQQRPGKKNRIVARVHRNPSTVPNAAFSFQAP